ncbi:hypothetical protein [Piscirickettsia litoralis]|uniref:Uncharacterized protein n=1 Tax=Piscirickettsia litoralis TaxID=1891921 RepID=A0ABX3A0Q1_9GAMM|nr:hypothetical protein [Piscirickettsia litoralis]ODN42204.1 hypothetical protein BGC07_03715 [Piscirickettsia litoralis]
MAFDKTKSPQFNQVVLDTGCASYPRTFMDFSIWLEKKGHIDYSRQSVAYVPTPDDFYHFHMPISLENKFNQYASYAAKNLY